MSLLLLYNIGQTPFRSIDIHQLRIQYIDSLGRNQDWTCQFSTILKTSSYNNKNFPPILVIETSIHGGFHGDCIHSKANKISSLLLKSGCNGNMMIFLPSIMATYSKSEITTNWEMYWLAPNTS